MTAYYNEFDPFAAEWLRELIKAGVIAPGIVDDRSILDVTPNDLKDFNQCHFFAGIGVWSYALRNARWHDSRPVWTGSCPCQPFSAAGSRAGFADERHLWPAFHYLIQECGPDVVLGEQVASKDGRAWLDHVQTDMENLGFAIGAGDICAAGFGAPHIRQRLFFVAERVGNAIDTGLERYAGHGDGSSESRRIEKNANRSTTETGGDGGLADTTINGVGTFDGESYQGVRQKKSAGGHDISGRLADTERQQRQRRRSGEAVPASGSQQRVERLCDATPGESPTGPTNGFWRSADWLYCRDEKWRPIRPGSFPLAHGVAGRVGLLRGYGNGIVAPLAQTFIEAYIV